MSKMSLYAQFANYLSRFAPTEGALRNAYPGMSRKQLKRLRPQRFKPAFSMGFRGAPKTETRPGSIPAPTIDEVRYRERRYGQKIHVKNGLMFFAADGTMWTAAEAELRSANGS